MSDEQNKDFGCNGNCSSCGSDCGDLNLEQPTVTLTLDDDSEVTCAILTIFPAGGKEYIALLPLNEDGENEDGEVYLYRYLEMKMVSRLWIILKQMKNTTLLLMHLMN